MSVMDSAMVGALSIRRAEAIGNVLTVSQSYEVSCDPAACVGQRGFLWVACGWVGGERRELRVPQGEIMKLLGRNGASFLLPATCDAPVALRGNRPMGASGNLEFVEPLLRSCSTSPRWIGWLNGLANLDFHSPVDPVR